MSDFLLESAVARSLIRTLGLPLPAPEILDRATGPWEAHPLEGRSVLLGTAPRGDLGAVIARTVAAAGSDIRVDAGDLLRTAEKAAEPYGRSALALGERETIAGLVFDATGISSIGDLRTVYDFFHRRLGQLDRSGRVVLIGRSPESASDAGAAAARRALEGLIRSIAKEVGRRGATAQTVLVERGAEERLDGVLRFLLSKRSAFVSAQPFVVTTRVRANGNVPWVRPLDRKVAIVTGAARGIGAATATRLAEEGAHVVCLDRPADAESLSELARRIGGSALLVDVTEANASQKITAELRERHGGVDLVIHNAGITRDKTLVRMDPELWDQALSVNLEAPVRITEALLGGCLHDEGRIVCLSSIAGIAGNVGQSNYSASKAGLIGFVQHHAERLAGRGITVNAVAPGFIETRLTAAIPFFVREAGRRLSALGQGGLPEDVAEVITFLATPGAAGLTGSVVRICGGAYLGA